MTSRTISGLTGGTTHPAAVTAYDMFGERGGYSSKATTTIPYMAPAADFSVSSTSGTALRSANLTGTSTGTINTYAWTFGD